MAFCGQSFPDNAYLPDFCGSRMHGGRSIKTTPKGFEPSRAEPSGFLVHLLNHSDTVSRKASSGPNWIIAITELQTNVNLTKITPCRTRTYNLWIRSPTRYPLRHEGPLSVAHRRKRLPACLGRSVNITPTVGLEPTTTSLKGWRSTN